MKKMFLIFVSLFLLTSGPLPQGQQQLVYNPSLQSDRSPAQSAPKKVGVLFGTFDPPHIGHRELALAMKNKFALDIVYFIPRDKEDYKPGKQTIQARNKMVELLLEDYPELKLVPSTLATVVKGLRSEEAFSVLRETFPASQVSLILGDDTINSLMLNQVRIPENFQLLVSRREGNEAIDVPESLDGKPVHVLHVSEESSSTKVRNILSEGGVPEMLPPKVYKFIKSQKLYMPAPLKPVPLPGNCIDIMNSLNQSAP